MSAVIDRGVLIVAAAVLLPSSIVGAAPHDIVLQLAAPRQLRVGQAAPGFTRNRLPGQPPLPQRDLAVGLHPRAALGTLRLEVTSRGVEVMPARGRKLTVNPPWVVLRHGTPGRLLWGPRRSRIVAGRDQEAYGDGLFPRRPVQRVGVSNRRGLKVLHLRYFPLRYRASGAELQLDHLTTVHISYRLEPGGSTCNSERVDEQLRPHLALLENAQQARRFYGFEGGVTSPRTLAASKLGYAIVVRDALRQQSKRLDDFIAHKESLGMKVTVVGDAELNSMGDGPSSSPAEDARRIRSWLQQSYKALDLKYVLLIGNPDPSRRGVPMALTHAMSDDANPDLAPSDHYYADLTGDWDLDGDGRVAEYPDDRGDGGVDFAPEVYVGRIPVYDDNSAALDQILVKTIAYASSAASSRSWRRRVLQPAAVLFFDNQYGEEQLRLDGADIAAAIHDQVISARRGVTHTALYEQEGLDPSRLVADGPLSRDNLIQTWKSGYGVVNMIGHGSADGIFRLIWDEDNGNAIPEYGEISDPAFLTYDDAAQLDDKHPSFVFHASCSNAEPERPDNLAYGLLRQGAVGTVSSTRVVRVVLTTGAAASANIFGLSRSFIRGMLDGRTAGEALFDAKLEIGDELGKLSWFTRLEIGLYGDPSLALTSCENDAGCDDGDACNGSESCSGGQCEPGAAVECSSDDPCREPICDPDSGSCEIAERPDGERCDDGRFCTIDDRCRAGRCLGSPRCAAPNNPCLLGACDEGSQRCDVYVPLDDGRACHMGTDREGTCYQGVCQPAGRGCVAGAPGALPRAWLLPTLLLGLLTLLAGYRSRTRR